MLEIVGYIILFLIIYSIPSIIAVCRLHNNAKRIVFMNIAIGWTFVGWAWAFIWALQSPTADYSHLDKAQT